MHQVTRKCACCEQVSKCRHRDFNSQIWVLLLHWGEIDESALEQPICDNCYRDLRNLLIDRSDEMEQLLNEGLKLEDVLAERSKSGSKRTVAEKSAAGKDGKKSKLKISKAS